MLVNEWMKDYISRPNRHAAMEKYYDYYDK